MALPEDISCTASFDDIVRNQVVGAVFEVDTEEGVFQAIVAGW